MEPEVAPVSKPPKPQITIGTLVAVKWYDAHARALAEQTLEDIAGETLVTFTSYGLLVRDDATVVAVAADVRFDEGFARYRGVTFIPRGMVKNIVAKAKIRVTKRTK